MGNYIKTGGKIVKRYYNQYCKMAEALNIEPVPFHAFSIKAYNALEQQCKQKKIVL